MEAPQYGEEYKITKICVDSYDKGILDGRIYQYNPEFEEGIVFHNTMAFLKYMEFAAMKTTPQCFKEKRTFQKVEAMEIEKPSQKAIEQGKVATFIMRILFRQHASWQGTVFWCEKNKEVNFRSVLELLFLIDSAVKE